MSNSKTIEVAVQADLVVGSYGKEQRIADDIRNLLGAYCNRIHVVVTSEELVPTQTRYESGTRAHL